MTLRSRDVKPLEAACAEIVSRAKNQDYETKGPVRIPTKILRITTRKTPCGEGSKTWDRYEMRIHKRVIDIMCPSSVVKEITNFRIDPGVDVNLINKSRPQHQNDLLKLLPSVSDPERQSVREQILDTLSKSMNPSQVKQLMDQNNMGGGGTTGDRGEYSEMTALEISIQLETLIYAKYSDTSAPNYKALSKKVVTSIKSREDQRMQLLEMKEQSDIEDFLQTFMSSRGRGLAAQQQESSGSQAASNAPPQSQSNPFAFPQVRPGPPGMAPNQSRKPPAAQNRFPQNRFMAPQIFQQPPNQKEEEQVKKNEQNEQAMNWDNDEPKEYGRTQLNQNENQNKNLEESSKGQSKQNMQYSSYAESGAADQSLNFGQQREERKEVESKVLEKRNESSQKIVKQDDLDFFNQLAENAVKQQQQNKKSPYQDQFHQKPQPYETQQREAEVYQEQEQMFNYNSYQDQHSIQEEQSRGYPLQPEIQEQPELRIPNQRPSQNYQEEPQVSRTMLQNPRQTQEGRIFDSKDNLEQEEGLQNQYSLNEQRPVAEEIEQNNSQQYNDYLEDQNLEEEQRPKQVVEEERKSSYNDQVEQSQANNYDLPPKSSRQEKPLKQDFQIPDEGPGKTRNNTNYEKQRTSPHKDLSMIHTQSLKDLHDSRRLTPSVKGFIPISSSRPPQSVASVNITNLEDSEALIRAYKRKKMEVDEFKQKFYDIETEYFTLKEKSKHIEEENNSIKFQLQKAEKQLKDLMYKDSKNDRDLLQKQLQQKVSQLESYQKEIQNSKMENQRLRERMKDLMNRSKRPNTSDSHQSDSQQQDLLRERDHYMALANQYKQDYENLQNEFNDFKNIQHQSARTKQEETNFQIDQLQSQLRIQKQEYEQQIQDQISKNRQLQQELIKLQQQKSVSPYAEQKSSSNDRKSEESISFEKIQKDSPHGQDEITGFQGYYERKGSSDGSGGSRKKEEKGKSQNIQNNYFKNDETEKQSSAPPSQPKQQVQQPRYQQQERPPQQVFKNPQNNPGHAESHDFFDKLSSQGSQSMNTQQPKPIGKQSSVQQQQQQQSLVQNRQAPQQVQQIGKPPVRNQPPPQNAYGFDLDDMSFEQQKQVNAPPPQRMGQQQRAQPPPRQVQQTPARPQGPPPQNQKNQYRPQVQQKPQPRPQNMTQYGFQLEDSDAQVSSQTNAQAPNIIPRSMFD